MSPRGRKVAVTLTMILILLAFVSANLNFAYSNDVGGNIDVFTQKEPYGGKGPNAQSDAFSPQDVVILHALVTYNEMPVQNLLVAFNVITPTNASFTLTSKTNSSGIARVDFTISIPPIEVDENDIFGTWHVLANALIDGKFLCDTLTFRVDWIVELLSVKTIDENVTYREIFGIGGDVGLEIALKGIAMVVKTATIASVIVDEVGVPVNFTEIVDFKVSPNERLVFLYCKLRIPKWAFIGNATVFVSALTAPVTENGVAYCPEVSSNFTVLPVAPLNITFHDVAIVDVIPSAKSVEVGEVVNIDVLVQNEGTVAENFDVTALCDDISLATFPVSLGSYSSLSLIFTFNTSTVDPGNYTVTLSIPSLVGEADLTDNFFVDGIVEVKSKPPTIIHDIAVTNISLSNNSLYVGDLLEINVSITNKGTETEAFGVEAYYDFLSIGILNVGDLASKAQATVTFVWNTSLVSEGLYEISAYAPLPGDADLSDNTFVDGVVQIKAKPPPPMRRYYLTVRTDPVDLVAISGEGWYDEGTNVTLVALKYVSVSMNIRYELSHWDIDGMEKSGESVMITMNANHTATARYIRQYYFAVSSPFGTPSGTGWYDAGATAYAMLDIGTLDHLNKTQRIFTQWSGDAFGTNYAKSNPILMDKPRTAIGNWRTQYYLTVVSAYGVAGGQDWYDDGSTAYASLNMALIDHANGTRRVFINWGSDASGIYYAQSNAILMNAPKTAVANWKTQYYLTIRPDPPGIATIAGEGWYDEFSGVTVNAPLVLNYTFRYWDINSESQGERVNPINVQMNAPKTATAHYTLVTVYTLTITATSGGTTDPAPGTYSHVAGSTVRVEAVPTSGYVFDHWELDGTPVGSANPITVTMDRNRTLKAVFSPAIAEWFVPDWFYWLLLLLLLIVVALLLLWLYRRRMRRARESFYSGWTAWYYGYDLRKARRI